MFISLTSGAFVLGMMVMTLPEINMLGGYAMFVAVVMISFVVFFPEKPE